MDRDRREVLGQALRGACGLGALGLGLAAVAPAPSGRAGVAIRPPGALEGDRFAAACARCGLCARACPWGILALADRAEHAAVGTPYFVARQGPCEMCPDIPCVVACPTGALDSALTDIARARMGVAVLVGRETCLNLQGLRCDVCYRVCPLIGQAIALEAQHDSRTGKHAKLIPTVRADACTGCGKCEQACVLEQAAIKVLPLHLAAVKPDRHYRYGWKAEAKS